MGTYCGNLFVVDLYPIKKNCILLALKSATMRFDLKLCIDQHRLQPNVPLMYQHALHVHRNNLPYNYHHI